jgi:hypothetical protein
MGFGLVIEFIEFLYNSWPHFMNHYHTQTIADSHVYTSLCSVAVSNGGRSPYSGFPNYPVASVISFSQQQVIEVNRSGPVTNSLTLQPTHSTQLNWTLTTSLYTLCSLGTVRIENTALLLLRVHILPPLSSNGRSLQSHYLATCLHATIIKIIILFYYLMC